MVAKYSNGGWTMLNTKAETARQIEMCSIYNVTWRTAAKAGQDGNDVSGDSNENSNNSFSRANKRKEKVLLMMEKKYS